MKHAFMEKLLAMGEKDPRILFVTGDLGFGMVEAFAAKLPGQFINAGVAEQNMTGLATGLALGGRIVFTYSIGNFPTLRCLEQIRNDAAYHEANVKVVAMGGGFSYGAQGISHHATEDIAIMRSLPGLTVVAPGCDWEASEATEALAYHPGTTYLRLDKMSAGITRRGPETFQLGRARRLRDGSDLTIVVTGGILKVALSSADALAGRGIHCRVLSMHTVKPLDESALFSAARETGGILTLEEHTVDGGLGGAVAEVCLEKRVLPAVFHRLGLRAGFSSVVGSQLYLQKRYGLDEAAVVKTVTDMLSSTATREDLSRKRNCPETDNKVLLPYP